MKFHYQAKQRDGTTTSGDIEADSLVAARQQLRRDGLFVTKIEERSVDVASGGARLSLGKRTNRRDLLMMMSQLTIMCQSGVDLAEAIENVARQAEKPVFRAVLEAVHEDISAGVSFSEALRRHPQVFDETFVAGVAAGEQTGAITPVLQRLTYLIRSDMKLTSAVWSMLMYPLVLCAVTFLVLNALVFFVLPQFGQVFTDLGRTAPPLTQMLLDAGNMVSQYKWILLGIIAVAVGGAVAGRNTEFVARTRDRVIIHGMVIRKATRALISGRMFRLLGTMLASGVPLVDGIRLCRQTSKNAFFRELFDQIEHDVLHGEGLGRSLLQAPFLPAGAAQMVATAERSGNLGDVLQNIGEHFEEEGERHIRDLVKILEPAVIVFLGVVVAGVVLAVVLPLLDVSTGAH